MLYCGAKLKNGKKCKKTVKKKGKRCRLHSGRPGTKMETHGTIYSSGDKLATFYRKNLVKNSFLKKGILEMADISKEISDFCSDLEGEIIVGRSILRTTLIELDNFSNQVFPSEEDESRALGRRMWMRGQIMNFLKVLSELVEKHHKVKYGEEFTIKIESVQQIFLTFNEILMRNITDGDLLKKIVNDMEKSLVVGKN